MPSVRSPSQATAGTLSNWVLYHVERGMNRQEILTLAHERRPNAAWQTIYSLANYWQSVKSLGNRFQSLSANTNVSRLTVPSQTGSAIALRISATATFSGGVGRMLKRGREYATTVDVGFVGNVGEIRQAVLDKIMQEISRKYSLRKQQLQGKLTVEFSGVQSI